jgi:hypothetical protein
MRVIRRGVFETNSSSTHSITMCSKEDYDKWEKGEILFDRDEGQFITKEEAIQKLKNDKYYKNLDFNDEEDINEVFGELNIYTSEEYFDDEFLENFEHTYITKNGETIVAFGKYGYDG